MEKIEKETDVVKSISESDLLDRQAFVDNLLLISNILSKNKKNACYAIDGSWGVGKSFVLDMFEEQAQVVQQDNTTLSKYLIFRYNCWEYDYYEEPLIAIVASLLDDFDKKVHLIPKSKQKAFVEVLKVVGKKLLKNAIKVADKVTGVPFEAVAEVIEEGVSTSKKQDAESKSFDEYISFKKTLKELQKGIASVADDQTVIFVVDELDRCLPEYSIKVLERIHHLFNGTSNVQVILSLDKTQLSHVVKRIYGERTDVNKYLAKFISMELKLTEGSISDQEKFDLRFNNYINLFSGTNLSNDIMEVDEFKNAILEGVDMRNRIAIIEKCLLLHSMINKTDAEIDPVFMCVELFLATIKTLGIDIEKSKNNFHIGNMFSMTQNITYTPKCFKLISLKYDELNKSERCIQSTDYSTYVCAKGIWGPILLAYRDIIGYDKEKLLIGSYNSNDIKKYARDFWGLMQTIC